MCAAEFSKDAGWVLAPKAGVLVRSALLLGIKILKFPIKSGMRIHRSRSDFSTFIDTAISYDCIHGTFIYMVMVFLANLYPKLPNSSYPNIYSHAIHDPSIFLIMKFITLS